MSILRRLLSSKLFHFICNPKRDWEISAPYIYWVKLDATSGDQIAESLFSLDLTSIKEILAKILPYHHQLYLEGSDHFDCSALLEMLNFLENHKAFYHLQTRALWPKPQLMIDKLRRLRFMESLRIEFPSTDSLTLNNYVEEENEASLALSNLTMAVNAGLNVWMVTPQGKAPTGLTEMVIHLKNLGVRGIAFRRQAQIASLDNAAPSLLLDEIGQLQGAGYPVILEDCLPGGLDRGLTPHCRGGIGSAFIDGQGNMKGCRHSREVLGNLLESDLRDLWVSSPLTTFRSAFLGQFSLSSFRRLYQQGCPFLNDSVGTRSAGTQKDQPPAREFETAVLSPHLCPVPLFTMRSEPRGAILIKGPDFIPVSDRGAQVVAKFNGRTTVKSLRREFGEEALALAYSLFCQHFIRLERGPDEENGQLPGTQVHDSR